MIDEKLDVSLGENGVLLTVNRRLARVLHQQYQHLRVEDGASVWKTPSIMPFDAWLRSLFSELQANAVCRLQLLDAEQEQLVWHQILLDSKVPLLSTSATASSLARAWKTHNDYIAPQSGSLESSAAAYMGEDQQLFSRWAGLFVKKLEENNWVDGSRLPLLLVEHLDQLKDLALLPAQIDLAGFPVLTPLQVDILQKLEDAGVRLNRDLAEDLANRSAKRAVNSSAESPTEEWRERHKHCVQVIADDSDAEMLQMANWARQRIEAAPELQLGCVVPDLHQRRHEVRRIFDQVFFPARNPDQIEQAKRPYDISLGKPLSDWPIAVSALDILEFATHRLEGAELTRYLLSPYLGEALRESSARAALDRKIRKSGMRLLTAHGLASVEGLPGGLSKQLKSIKKISLGRCGAAEWCQRFSKLLEASGWPGDNPLDSNEHQAFEAWQDLLQSTARLDDMLGVVSAGEMLGQIKRLASQKLFQPETGNLPVQIIGVLESAGLVFDELWVSGMDAASWPLQSRADPWLPTKLQKQAGVPGASHQQMLFEAALVFERWTDSAATVFFSYANSRDGLDNSAAHALKDLQQVSGSQLTDIPANAAELISTAADLEIGSDTQGPALAGDAAGGARLFEDQASCAFRSFALHRLLARPLEEPGMGLDAREQGTAFHDSIENFWAEVKTHAAFVALGEAEFQETLHKCVGDALQALPHESAVLLELERNRLVRNVGEWLNRHERNREPFSVVATEEELESEFEGLKLSLKVDRIDELDSGEKVIIDYKTGSNNQPGKWMAERPENAQLPLYATLSDGIDALCYAQVMYRNSRFLGKARTKGLLPQLEGPAKIPGRISDSEVSWQDNLDFWKDKLALLADEVTRGVASVTPQAKACDYCHLKGLCRLDSGLILKVDDSMAEDGTAEGNTAGGDWNE